MWVGCVMVEWRDGLMNGLQISNFLKNGYDQHILYILVVVYNA